MSDEAVSLRFQTRRAERAEAQVRELQEALRRISEAKKGIDTAGIALAALARLDIPSPNVI
jgi:hypothetical protein